MTTERLGQRIREERKYRGQTQDEVARRVNVDRTSLNKIENGSRRVTALELAGIAEAIGVRMASFFEEPVSAVVSHRSSQGLDTVDSQIDALLADLANEIEFVQKMTPFISQLPGIPWDHPTSAGEAEEMAHAAREALGYEAAEPAIGLAQRLATVGLLVFTRSLGIDTADAGTLLLREGGVSLVNSSGKVGRRRLAAAHELAHFLVADEYTIDWRVVDDSGRKETLFDRFARGVLLPRRELTTRWRDANARSGLRTAAVLVASEFQVDMTTLARRLVDLDLVDASAAGGVRAVRTTQADLIEHDLYPGDELAGDSQPRLYQQAVLRLVREERISQERALDLLAGTLAEDDLPAPPVRSETSIWEYVS